MSETDVTETVEATDEPQKLDLKVDVESPSACQRHIKVEVSRIDVDRYLDDAVGEMMEEANVPGFRKGRAPRKLVESQFKGDLKNQIKGSLLLDSMTQVTEDEDFSAISEPDFDFEAVEIPDEGPMVFEFDLEVRPEFEMPKWKGLKIEKPVKEFGKKEIDQHLTRILAQQAEMVSTKDPAENEDTIVADMKVSHDGDEISSYKACQFQVRETLSFPDGNLEKFNKLVSGAKAGDSKSGKAKISEQAAAEDMRGKEVDVELNILDVKRMQLPELTPELLSQLGDFKEEGDLRDAVKDDLERQLGYHQNQAARQQITSLLTESANWELPPDLLKRQSLRELERSVMELRSSGFSEDQIRQHVNILRQNSEESTATALKEHFILERIAEENELEATDADYDLEIQMIALQSGESPRSVRARIEKQGLMDALRNQIVERMALDLIKEQASFKEVPFKPSTAQVYASDHSLCGVQESSVPEAKHGGDKSELQQPVDRT